MRTLQQPHFNRLLLQCSAVVLFFGSFCGALALAPTKQQPASPKTSVTSSPSALYWSRTSGTPSMEPGLTGQVDICICPEVYRQAPPQRFDVIVFRAPDEDANYVKRVIGLPGDLVVIYYGKVAVISDGEGTVLEEPYLGELARDHTFMPGHPPDIASSTRVPAGHLFVLGDNRPNSRDSRDFGPIPVTSIIGKVVYPTL